ncbi:MAG: hypothetical protein JSU85_07035 [Candidatus Zixiibacteriota bacterium]|nr:MAG: hypothetical protein JSU85_07035 [candidate division Zixibacteria bacterium]
MEDIKPAYEFLYGPGFLTTKTVWILPAIEPLNFPNCGESLSDSAHADFILDLKEKGFEIALHGCRGGSTRRAEIINSPEKYNDIIGDHPKIHINHNINKNNFYWGADRLDLIPLKIFYTLLKGNTKYYGHIPESEYFWDDFAQQHISYVGSWKEFYEIASRNNSMYFKKPVYYSPLNSSQT